MPGQWHEATVTSIFKKGAPDVCDNYRPISLLCVAYKVYATIILRRLQTGGAENRLTPTQFGFRRGFGTDDAIFCLRRLVESAIAHRNGHVAAVALDWKKAFDSINPDILVGALRRFGLPEHTLAVIAAIYEGRTFRVASSDGTSNAHPQGAGIAQGCPLSPFLFCMVMTVLLEDAVRELSPSARDKYDRQLLMALLYADDTLLVGYDQDALQSFVDAVANVGARYGLELHCQKFQFLRIQSGMSLRSPDGSEMKPRESILYLGTTISADGLVGSEFNRRLGAAWSEYSKLSRLWKHTHIPLARKVEVLGATVMTKLLFGLKSVWLNKKQQRHLNGFQARCFRDLLRIPHPQISRISNKTILERVGQAELSRLHLRRQLLLFGRIARAPDSDLRRRLTFCPGSLEPVNNVFVRKVGRPRLEWAQQLMTIALRKFGSHSAIKTLIQDPFIWQFEVNEKI